MELVILTVLSTLAGMGMLVWAVLVWRAWREQNVSRAKLTQAIDHLNATCTSLLTYAHSQEKLLEGLIKVSQEEVHQLGLHAASVDLFRKTLVKGETGDNFSNDPDPDRADRVWEIEEYKRSGMPEEEAIARVQQADVFRRMKVTG